jgi:hypothetical protein
MYAVAHAQGAAGARFVGRVGQRLRRIEVERLKSLNEVHILSKSQDLGALHTALRRLAALERYSQRSDSKLRKTIVEKEVRPR